MPLDMVLHDRKRRQYHQIPDGRDHQQRDHFQIAAIDDLDRVEQLRQGKDIDLRSPLGEANDVVEGGGQDGAHRLRQNDAGRLPPPGKAECCGSLKLPLINRENAATDDFGCEGGLIERQP